ncbi:MAG: C4-type zinc ribbon domain-containing protein [Phycisphaerales bacterium]
MSLTEDLISLFHIDSNVRGLRRRLESAQRYLDGQDRQLADLNQQHEECEVRRRHVRATAANLEGEVEVLDERLEKLREELNVATTNKQYTAVLTERNVAKGARADLEDRILEEMETIEDSGKQLEKIAEQTAERQKIRTVAEKQLKQRHDEVGERLSELEVERESAAGIIPSGEIRIFDEMAEAYEGEAMSQIEEIDRRNREYACGSCNMHLPFEAVASLLAGGAELVRCTACGRILYLAEETRGALARK